MHRLNNEELEKKLGQVYDLGFVDDILINDTETKGKVVGREIIIETNIGNTKSAENKQILNSLKTDLKNIFGKTFKERVNIYGNTEFFLVSRKAKN